MRECTKCHQMKEESEYYVPSATRKQIYRECKKCMAERTSRTFRKNRYGMTYEEYQALLDKQLRCCAICKMSVEQNGRLLAVDHDHSTGQVRQILCDRCNRMLGQVQDDPNILIAAADYLVKHKSQ
jgi:Recombination endonuclease VII